MGLGIAGYSGSETGAIRHKLLDRVAALPGVRFASLTDWLPFNYNRKTADVYPQGHVPQPHESLEVRRAEVSDGYFATLGIPIVEGRPFTRDDNEKAPRVVIVDQTAANHYWPGQDADWPEAVSSGAIWYTVVGVVKNSKHQWMGEAIEPMVYLSYFQNGGQRNDHPGAHKGRPGIDCPGGREGYPPDRLASADLRRAPDARDDAALQHFRGHGKHICHGLRVSGPDSRGLRHLRRGGLSHPVAHARDWHTGRAWALRGPMC